MGKANGFKISLLISLNRQTQIPNFDSSTFDCLQNNQRIIEKNQLHNGIVLNLLWIIPIIKLLILMNFYFQLPKKNFF